MHDSYVQKLHGVSFSLDAVTTVITSAMQYIFDELMRARAWLYTLYIQDMFIVLFLA